MSVPLDKAAIAAVIPHSGRMCLLDAVIDWTETSIRCRASSHRDPDNPLRRGDSLGVLCGIEYAAQAMAVHGGLSAPSGARSPGGYLASVRDVVGQVDRLDLVDADLEVVAERVLGDTRRAVYEFELRAAGRPLLTGRAAVLLRPPGDPP